MFRKALTNDARVTSSSAVTAIMAGRARKALSATESARSLPVGLQPAARPSNGQDEKSRGDDIGHDPARSFCFGSRKARM